MYNYMIEVEVNVKEWGNSLGVILPRNLAKKEKIKSGDKIKMIIVKEQTDLSDIFGMLKDSKINSQKVKDDLRKEWSKL